MSQSSTAKELCCPHCGAQLQQFEIPGELGWDELAQWACFNDDCSYFREGWEWMLSQYNVKTSYRYRICPATGQVTPLSVWSKDAIKDRIIKSD